MDCPSEPIELNETILRIAIIISGLTTFLGRQLTEKTPVIGQDALLDQPTLIVKAWAATAVIDGRRLGVGENVLNKWPSH